MWLGFVAGMTTEIALTKVLGTGKGDHRQGHRDITGKRKGYAASGSEESYVDLIQHTISFSHLERSPMRWR